MVGCFWCKKIIESQKIGLGPLWTAQGPHLDLLHGTICTVWYYTSNYSINFVYWYYKFLTWERGSTWQKHKKKQLFWGIYYSLGKRGSCWRSTDRSGLKAQLSRFSVFRKLLKPVGHCIHSHIHSNFHKIQSYCLFTLIWTFRPIIIALLPTQSKYHPHM